MADPGSTLKAFWNSTSACSSCCRLLQFHASFHMRLAGFEPRPASYQITGILRILTERPAGNSPAPFHNPYGFGLSPASELIALLTSSLQAFGGSRNNTRSNATKLRKLLLKSILFPRGTS